MRNHMIDAMLKFSTGGFALVIGDLMLDKYIAGDCTRISPEAPVPILHAASVSYKAGGAANVAMNLRGLYVPTHIVGLNGHDGHGDLIAQILGKAGVRLAGLVTSHRLTTAKTRFMSGQHQMMRVDEEDKSAIDRDLQHKLWVQILREVQGRPKIVILSDYNKGVLTDELCQKTIALCKSHSIPVLVDPKGDDYTKYIGAVGIKPNRIEAQIAFEKMRLRGTLSDCAKMMLRRFHFEFVVMTLALEGMHFVDEVQSVKIRSKALKVYDVSGAGDTVIATMAAGMMSGLSRIDAMELSNIAAGIVVGKVGTSSIEYKELLEAISPSTERRQKDKIIDLVELFEQVRKWRASGYQIIFTNGCFDLLHAGHVSYLESAKKEGSKLVVCINDDKSVTRIKGPTRPVIGQDDRARVLAALESVDAVCIFHADTPIEIINAIKPDVLVKGADYTEDEIVGAAEVKSWGGSVQLIELEIGQSTSGLIESVRTKTS